MDQNIINRNPTDTIAFEYNIRGCVYNLENSVTINGNIEYNLCR